MRRDVRMGFAVGGVLLAVIIVAILVIHRNQSNKAVAFDKGTGGTSSLDVNAGPADSGAAPVDTSVAASQSAMQAKIEQPPAAPQTSSPKPAAEPEKPAAPADDRWDALFASTAANPVQNQLSQGRNRKGQVAQAPAASDQKTRLIADPGPVGEQPAVKPSTGRSRQDSAGSTSAPAAGGGNGARTHTIAANETLSSIAKIVYGDGRHYKAIQDANPGIDPMKLRPGMVLQIPALEKAKQAAKTEAAEAVAAADGKTYVVQKDDNLYKITRKLYGNGDKQDELYTLNKQTIGPDSTKLKPGMVLKLPAAPAAQ